MMYERTAALKVVSTLVLVYHHLLASSVHSALVCQQLYANRQTSSVVVYHLASSRVNLANDQPPKYSKSCCIQPPAEKDSISTPFRQRQGLTRSATWPNLQFLCAQPRTSPAEPYDEQA